MFSTEGKALWLLFTFPRPFTAVLLEKASLWVLIALGYASAILGFGLLYQAPSAALVWGALYGLSGLCLLALIGTGLGASLVDATAVERSERSTRGSGEVALFYALSAAFICGLYTDAWTRLSLLALLGAVTVGVVQSAARAMPFMLEPELKPPPIVSLLDGLVCAFLFLVLQAVGVHIATDRFGLHGWLAMVAAFTSSGALVTSGAWLVFRLRGVPNVGARLGWVSGARPSSIVRHGLRWAAPAVAVALAFVVALHHSPWLRHVADTAAAERPPIEGSLDVAVLLLLSVAVAPLCEELIFRGMIYGALRERLAPAASALLSAAVFAAIHPSIACVPVFLMAICSCMAFERSKSLFAPVLVHAAYNGALFALSALVT